MLYDFVIMGNQIFDIYDFPSTKLDFYEKNKSLIEVLLSIVLSIY